MQLHNYDNANRGITCRTHVDAASIIISTVIEKRKVILPEVTIHLVMAVSL